MKNYLNNIPLRTALIIPFAFLVVMAIGFVGYVSYANGRLAVNDVASQLRSELTLRIQDHLRQFLKTPHQINQLNADMLNQGLLNINNPAEMERHFFSQISTFDSVTSIYMGNVDGGVVNSGRDFATNSRYIIVTDDFKSGPLHKIATTDTGRRMEILATVPNFDARTRPWYFGAVKKGAASWSPVYIISTGQDMAIAASQPIYDDQKQLLGVVSTDIFLSHISHFIKNLKMGQTGIAFIVDATGFLIASSNDEKPFTKSDTSGVQQRRHAEESLSPIIRHAARILSGRFNDQDWANGIQQFDFTVDNQRQLMQVTPLRDGYGLEWTIVVVIPEADFMSKIIANNSASVFVIVVVLVFALAIDIVVTKKITQPILALNAAAQNLAKGEWGQSVRDVSRIREVRSLTQSFNHMTEFLQNTLDSLNHEVAERKQAEDALRESEERWSYALEEGAGAGVWDWNAKTNRVFYSRKWKTMLGYEDHEIGDGLDEWQMRVHPEDLGQTLEKINRHLTGGTPEYLSEHRLRCKDGDYKWILDQGKVIEKTPIGEPVRVIGTHTDITGQKRAEAEKKALQDQLFQARKADSLGRMAGAVAHHYNNLLSVVIGNLELADMDEPQNSGRLKLIRAAMNAARRAADISTQMLTYLGQGIGKHVPIPLSVICHRKLAQITDAMPDTITLHTHLPDPGPLVQADADQIAQVLSNLVMNASEAIGGKVGEIRVSIGILTAAQAWVLNPYPVDWEPKSAEYACLSIQDTGEGMNPETVEKIFDPFFSTRFIGRGLGLSVVLGIVKAHDGAVSVETLSGSGSIFRIFLPVADENPPTETGDPAKPDVLIGVC